MNRFGPFPKMFIDQIVEVLDRAQINYQVQWDQGLLEKSRRSPKNTMIVPHPTFEGHSDLAYVVINEEDLSLLPEELEKFGFVLATGHELDGEDYLCPKCDFHSDVPGFCPKHRVRLLNYEDYKRRRAKADKRTEKIVIWILLLVMLVAGGLYLGDMFDIRLEPWFE